MSDYNQHIVVMSEVTMKLTSVRLSPELHRQIAELVKRTHRSRSFYLQAAIEAGLPQVLAEYDLQARALAVRNGDAETYPLDEVIDELGLDR